MLSWPDAALKSAAALKCRLTTSMPLRRSLRFISWLSTPHATSGESRCAMLIKMPGCAHAPGHVTPASSYDASPDCRRQILTVDSRYRVTAAPSATPAPLNTAIGFSGVMTAPRSIALSEARAFNLLLPGLPEGAMGGHMARCFFPLSVSVAD